MKTGTVAVLYGFRDGYHVFTSDELYGLYIASKDPETAFNGIVPAIETLMRENEGIDIKAEPAFTLSEFLSVMRAQDDGAPESAPPPAFMAREFLIHATM